MFLLIVSLFHFIALFPCEEMADGADLTREKFDQAMLTAGTFAESTLETLVGAKAQLNVRK